MHLADQKGLGIFKLCKVGRDDKACPCLCSQEPQENAPLKCKQNCKTEKNLPFGNCRSAASSSTISWGFDMAIVFNVYTPIKAAIAINGKKLNRAKLGRVNVTPLRLVVKPFGRVMADSLLLLLCNQNNQSFLSQSVITANGDIVTC